MRQLKTFLLCFFIVVLCDHTHAQRPIASNGNFKTVNGIKMYYETLGSGKPLILLHTFFGTTEQWGTYREELSKKFKVITIDLPGHGRSDVMDTSDIYDNTRAAKYIIGLLDQLKIDSAYFWGASSGGTIILRMATIKPELVSKMVVLGAQLYYSPQTRNWGKERGYKSPDNEGITDHGIKKATLLEKQFYRYFTLYDELNITPDLLSVMKAKSLIISGDNDFAAPFLLNALPMYQNIPGAQLWVVPNGYHLPHLDDFNHADFLTRVSDFLNQ